MPDPRIQTTIEAYFCAVSEGDEEAFAACLRPDILFFGSMGGTQLRGIDPLRGAFRALRERFPSLSQRAARTFGEGPEIAVLVDLSFGMDPGMQGLWIFRFDAEARVERLSALWDPQRVQLRKARWDLDPEVDFTTGSMDPALQSVMDNYFETFNQGDEGRHVSLYSPEVAYFGSVSRMTAAGIATMRGVFRGARESFGIRRLTPTHYFGRRQEVAVLVKIAGAGAGGPETPETEGVWGFRFDDHLRIERMSVLWNASDFLRRPPRL